MKIACVIMMLLNFSLSHASDIEIKRVTASAFKISIVEVNTHDGSLEWNKFRPYMEVEIDGRRYGSVMVIYTSLSMEYAAKHAWQIFQNLAEIAPLGIVTIALKIDEFGHSYMEFRKQDETILSPHQSHFMQRLPELKH